MMAGWDLPGFEDVELIGAGGFGRVFRAGQPEFGRTVAVKILNGRLDDETILRRFRRECQALGAVAGHPNIVSVFDAGATPDGQPYLVMDYLAGGSLADRLRRAGPLPWAEVAAIGVKLAGALHTAHAAGVLHRDIKPENILVSGYGEPQLADFGIAQRAGIENRTTTAATMTPSHTAPEQFSGGPPTTATDVYALASTLHTLLAGSTPFQGRPDESVFALIARAATEPAPDLRPHGVPDAVAGVIEAGLAKHPPMRPSSALAFGRLLAQAQQALNVPETALPVARDDVTAGVGGEGIAGFVDVTPSPDATRPRVAPAPIAAPSTTTAGPAAAAVAQPLPGPPRSRLRPPPIPMPPLVSAPNPEPAPPPMPPSTPPPGRARSGRALQVLVATTVAALLVVAGVVLAHRLLGGGGGTTGAGSSGTGSGTGAGAGSASGSEPAGTTATDGTAAASGATAGTPSPAAGLAGLLLRAGQPPLDGWSDGGGLAAVITPDTAFFCRRTVDLASGSDASALFTGPDNRILDQHVYRVGAARATKAMSELRASASCGSWTGDLSDDRMSVAAGRAVSVGDDAASYLVTSALAQTYQVFFRQGGDVCVITLGAVGGTVTPADRDLATRAATAAATRLGAG